MSIILLLESMCRCRYVIPIRSQIYEGATLSCNSVTYNALLPDPQHHILNPLTHEFKPGLNKTPQIPNHFKTPHYPTTNENIDKLKKWMLNQFAALVFNSCRKFPAMSRCQTHMHPK